MFFINRIPCGLPFNNLKNQLFPIPSLTNQNLAQRTECELKCNLGAGFQQIFSHILSSGKICTPQQNTHITQAPQNLQNNSKYIF